jgi:hypothetical protein
LLGVDRKWLADRQTDAIDPIADQAIASIYAEVCLVVFVVDCNCAPAFEQEDDFAPGSSGFHPIVSETKADDARNSADIYVRIFPTLARNAPRVRLSLRLPPEYYAAIEDQFMPNAREADVNDIGVCYERSVVSKPLTDKCVTPKPR